MEPTLQDIFDLIARRWRLLILGPIAAGLVSIGITLSMDNVYTSRTIILPPQNLGGSSSALNELSMLTGLAGGGGLTTPGELYVALLQTDRVQDQIIDKFDLIKRYAVTYRVQARSALENNLRLGLGRKDGLLTIQVDDVDPAIAAQMANQFVVELKKLAHDFTINEPQQRQAFLKGEFAQAKEDLDQAQRSLQASGFSEGALRVDARLAAENYARLKAGVANAEVRLRTLRFSLRDEAPEVQQAMETLLALRHQLAQAERASTGGGADAAYVSLFREFKYREAIYEALARQYSAASMDAGRDAQTIQVVDVARPAELKSRPKRAVIAVLTSLISGILLFVALYLHWRWRTLRSADLANA